MPVPEQLCSTVCSSFSIPTKESRLRQRRRPKKRRGQRRKAHLWSNASMT